VAKSIPKTATGIDGLDQILRGGLPAGRTTAVCGGPGSGKTVLALDFLYNGVMAGEPGVFLGFEENADAVRRNASAMGRDLAALERAGKLIVCVPEIEHSAVLTGDFDLGGLLAILQGQAQAIGAKRIVVDSIDVLLRIFGDYRRERNELVGLNNWLIHCGFTSVMTIKDSELSPGRYDFLEYIADCVVRLDQRVLDQIVTRRLRVLKCRGTGFARNEFPYVIDGAGIHILPISKMILSPATTTNSIASSGCADMDRLLGGGFVAGSSVLTTGRTGTGKTMLASTFVRAASQRRERSLYISFEESESGLLRSIASAGIDLRPAVDSGLLRMLTILPEAMGAEEHLFEAFRVMEEHQTQNLVVDSMSACHRMGSERAAFEYLMRLICACKEHGRTAFLINQQEGSDYDTISGLGISSLIDTVIHLRLDELTEGMQRDVLVVKSRGMKHSLRRHPFRITDAGIIVPDSQEAGVL
jgi:circadian clock protein KaiC